LFVKEMLMIFCPSFANDGKSMCMAKHTASTLFIHLVASLTLGCVPSFAQRLVEAPQPQQAERESREGAGAGLANLLDTLHQEPQRYRSAGGRVRVASLARSRSYAGKPVDAALGYLRDHGLAGPIPQSVFDVRELLGLTMVRVRSESEGIPVRGLGASLLIGPGNDVVAFTGDAGDAVTVNANWRIGLKEARGAVKQRYALVADDLPLEPFYQLQESKAEPYWEAVVSEPNGDWAVHVSAVTGQIERIESLRWGQAQGFAFTSNPLKDPLTQVQLANLTSSSNLTGVNAKIYSYLPNLLFLSQPRVFLQLAEPVGGNYLYSPSRPQFSEVQLYHGMDRAAQRFKDLGFGGFGRPLEGMVLYKDFIQQNGQSAFAGKNNAFFSPAQFNNRGGLFFYLTPRNLDTSWDSDVIFHEYTHAVVNALVGPNQGKTFGAINEGTADYFATSFLNDPAMGEWAARIFGLRGPAMRNVENLNRWPGNLVGQIHADGNIWSGSLWDLRKSLGAERADKIALGSLYLMNGSEEFFDAAVAVALSANALFGDSAANSAINVMINRGVGTDDAETASRAITLRSGSGAQASISAAAANSILLGSQQFRIDVPNQAAGLRIQVTASANVRFYIRYRAPVTIQNGQLVYEQFSPTPGINLSGTLGPDNTPELQAGTYYIAIANTTTQPVNYTITATISGGSPTAPPAVTVLTSGQRGTGSAPAGPFLASRQFAIDVPAGATGLSVSLSGNKDVDLYLSGSGPVQLNNQGNPEADFESASASQNETLNITSRTLPTNLLPGRYFIGVLNYASESASYSVTPNISFAAVPPTQTQLLGADSSVTINTPPYSPSSGAGSLVPQQISFTVPADAIGVRISASTSLDVDILVKKGSAYNAGGLNEYIYAPTASQPDFEINADSSPALQPGATYFLAIGNYSPTGGPVTLRYSVLRRAVGGGQISAAGVVSAASYQGGGVAPGEIVTLFGSGIGPASLVGLQLTGGRVSTQVEQTRILFDGVAAPIIYVSAGQVSCVVPYSVSGKSNVAIAVEFQGRNSNSVSVPVQAARPAIFTANSSGTGPGAILNQNGSVNTAANPADRNSVVVLYATGEGQTNPGGVDGQVANTVFPKPLGNVTATIGGVGAEVIYAGAAPGLVAGVFQVNLRVPAGTPPGQAVPVQLRVGGVFSRTGVTLAVQ